MSITTLTVTAKGQVTLKQALLQHLGVRPGDRLAVTTEADGELKLRVSSDDRDISKVFGMLSHLPPSTMSDNEAIMAEVARLDRATRR